MTINEHHIDTLAELINIAFGRAASSLSELTGKRVLLDVPHVAVRPIDDLVRQLHNLIPTCVAAIHQEVEKSFPGHALLLMSEESGMTLSELLTEHEASRSVPRSLDSADREALNEVGSILLHACIGTFGNILSVSMQLSPPHIMVDMIEPVLARILARRGNAEVGLIITTSFCLGDDEVKGYVVILLSVSSLDGLLEMLDRL